METSDAGDGEPLNAQPIAALLDGMPVENHAHLRGRLIVDDPEGFADFTPANAREHGTSMASLILHGDLDEHAPPLNRPLVVRPVMTYDAANRAEKTPPDRLPLDVIYQAVRRILEGDAGASASAPSVVVINLSLGDLNQPFSGRLSPWARLLDWLSFRYRVLFLVSAGNTRGWLPVRSYLNTRGRSRMRETRSSGSVRGASGDGRPYRESD